MNSHTVVYSSAASESGLYSSTPILTLFPLYWESVPVSTMQGYCRRAASRSIALLSTMSFLS